MKSFTKRMFNQIGVDVEEYTSGDEVLSSPRMEKDLSKDQYRGPAERERTYLEARRGAKGWILNEFRERAEFRPTLAYNEIEVVRPTSKVRIGEFSTSLGLARAFRAHHNSLVAEGYHPVRQHSLDSIVEQAPENNVFKIA